MKIKEDFVLRQIANIWVVLPLAEQTLDFNGMLTVTETGVLLWKLLEQGCNMQALADALLSEYEVSEEKAWMDAEKFVNKLIHLGCLEAD